MSLIEYVGSAIGPLLWLCVSNSLDGFQIFNTVSTPTLSPSDRGLGHSNWRYDIRNDTIEPSFRDSWERIRD